MIKAKYVRDCPTCKEKLLKHPTLEAPRILEQSCFLGRRFGFTHTTKAGRMLHNKVFK